LPRNPRTYEGEEEEEEKGKKKCQEEEGSLILGFPEDDQGVNIIAVGLAIHQIQEDLKKHIWIIYQKIFKFWNFDDSSLNNIWGFLICLWLE